MIKHIINIGDIMNLLELKETLNNIPEEVLEGFGVGVCDESVDVEIIYFGIDETEDIYEEAFKLFNKYKELSKLNKWITNILKAQKEFENNDDYLSEEPIGI